MIRSDKMISMHTDSLTSVIEEKYLKGFSKPIQDGDSVTSLNENKKIAFITRHLLTGEPTHSLILEKEFYDRV